MDVCCVLGAEQNIRSPGLHTSDALWWFCGNQDEIVWSSRLPSPWKIAECPLGRELLDVNQLRSASRVCLCLCVLKRKPDFTLWLSEYTNHNLSGLLWMITKAPCNCRDRLKASIRIHTRLLLQIIRGISEINSSHIWISKLHHLSL